MAGVPPPLFISTLDAVKQYSTQISDRYYDEVLIMIPISGVELFQLINCLKSCSQFYLSDQNIEISQSTKKFLKFGNSKIKITQQLEINSISINSCSIINPKNIINMEYYQQIGGEVNYDLIQQNSKSLKKLLLEKTSDFEFSQVYDNLKYFNYIGQKFNINNFMCLIEYISLTVPVINFEQSVQFNVLELSLTNCKLQNLNFTDSMPKLKRLELRNNDLIKIELQSNILEVLLIFQNPIKKICELESLNHLTLSHTKMSNLDFLSKSSKLHTLCVSDNYICSLKGIQKCGKLRSFYIQNNFVMTEQFRYLNEIPQIRLQTYYLTGNPTDQTLINKLCSMTCFVEKRKFENIQPINFEVPQLQEKKENFLTSVCKNKLTIKKLQQTQYKLLQHRNQYFQKFGQMIKVLMINFSNNE